MGRALLISSLFVALFTASTSWAADKSDLCRYAVDHKPDADVNYTPGTDQFGRDVVPADLDGGAAPVKIPDNIRVAITVNQAAQLGLNSGVNYAPEAFIGTAEITPDGTVLFNGERISKQRINALCNDTKTN